MKLDPRIKSLSDILTCFDIEEAKQFIGQKGYFALNIGYYKCLADIKYGTLAGVKDDDTFAPFKESDCIWDFFIPESLVENKKISRPFSIIEFKANLSNMIFPDGLIHFRDNKNGYEEYALRYNGYKIISQDTVICLGAREYSLKALFKKFEYLDKNGEWNMFGVEE